MALQQDPTHYTFPEQIYGLPEKAAIAAITSRGYPESIVNSTLATLRKKLAQLHDGRMRLADLATA